MIPSHRHCQGNVIVGGNVLVSQRVALLQVEVYSL